uniref:Chromatin target of PRMT1 protein C-terminal domain-containing protein n=1 Tax=Trypanosoma congolense (strain IL3000) TaxID=1068625 RepID=G0UN99_TRYCI|nr:conserved hypothetical protein [Trypanosoma congolense IL3000]
MRRNDFERRRLRDLYDRNVRRVGALAEARDQRRSARDDDIAAPRRYVVSERRTRLEGFGYGGRQIRRSLRTDDSRRRLRFSDRRIYRRGAFDRFARDEDFVRELRRDRLRDREPLRDRVQGRRFFSYGMRLSRLRRDRLRRRALPTRDSDRQRPPPRPQRGYVDDRSDRYDDAPRSARSSFGRFDGGRRNKGLTRQGLDEELDRFRGSN